MQNEAQGTKRGLKWLLIGSLALNMVLIGLIGGAGLKSRQGSARMDVGIGPITQFLTPDDRKAIGKSLRGRNDGRGPNRRDDKAFSEALVNALRADPFDRGAAEAAISQRRERGRNAGELVEAAFLDRLAEMSLDAREILAKRIEAPRKR